ncbi:MAG: hypothetical protein E7158_05015 [Firmicutes bacterium]|nr:hypothetical protein [Bacillota bacterium]
MKKKNGFLAVSIIFSFFIVFLMILTINMASYAQNRILLNQIKKDIKSETNLKIDKIEISNNCDPSTEECPRCIRAKTLHASGATKYGQLGTRGILTVGDAFDCDVNDDGEYNSDNERFYYLSGVFSYGSYNSEIYDENYASLIYYTNYGYPGTSLYSYYPGDGPAEIIEKLPNWTKPSLKSDYRNIYTETGTLVKSNFEYSHKNSRLPNYKEIEHACGPLGGYAVVALNCPFMYENLSSESESYWIEDYYNENQNNVWAVSGSYGSLSYYRSDYMGSQLKVRPVIEVAINDIEV